MNDLYDNQTQHIYIDGFPADYHQWEHCLNYTTPEGVPLEIRKRTKYIGTFYNRRLVAAARCLFNINKIQDLGDGMFCAVFTYGAVFQVHYDHIEYLNGYIDKLYIYWKDFHPEELIQRDEDSLWEGVIAKRSRQRESFSPTATACETKSRHPHTTPRDPEEAGRPRSGRRLFIAPVAAGARGKRHPPWKKAPRRAADYGNGSRTTLHSHSPPTNSSITAPLRGPPLR